MARNSAPPIPATEDDSTEEDAARASALERIEAFGTSLAKTRKEAVDGRQQSGIENDWLEDEEAYQGIDDANRNTTHTKPISSDGGAAAQKVTTTRSTVFLNITRPYVDAAAARVSDMLLPTDDRNWAMQPTPIPEMDKLKGDQTPMINRDLTPMTKDSQGPDGQPVKTPYTVSDHVQQVIEQAKQKAEAAQKRIEDWQVECQFHSEMRKIIEDSGRIGTGILKGPYPIAKKNKVVRRTNGMTEIVLQEEIKPASRWIDPWNFYPDPSCGENIHDGSYTWEKDSITKRKVQDLRDDPSYIQENLELVLEEGPQKKYATNSYNDEQKRNDKDRFEIWYYHGYADKEDMEAAGCDCSDMDSLPAMVVMINDRVVKAVIQPLDSGEFPYDVMPWQRRSGFWAGTGIARQIRTPQRMLNAATRNMMDNAGLSAGPQLIVRQGSVTPADGSWELTPRKVWYVGSEDDLRNIAEAFAAINIPTLQNELMAIIQFAQKMAEDVTGLPMMLQGQQGSAPETVGGMQMLNNNASTVMRRIARTFDDNITEPHIRRYYEWLLIHGEDEEEKGDFQIDARGSSALVERDIESQTIAQMGALVKDPTFGLNPKLWMAEFLKSKRLDPKRLEYTDEEFKRIQESMAANSKPPAVMVAEMKIKAEQDRHQLDIADRKEERAFRLQELQITRDIAIVKLSTEEKISIEKIKAGLAETAMVEKNKRDLYNAEQTLKIDTGSGI